jgi:hypothetical protein
MRFFINSCLYPHNSASLLLTTPSWPSINAPLAYQSLCDSSIFWRNQAGLSNSPCLPPAAAREKEKRGLCEDTSVAVAATSRSGKGLPPSALLLLARIGKPCGTRVRVTFLHGEGIRHNRQNRRATGRAPVKPQMMSLTLRYVLQWYHGCVFGCRYVLCGWPVTTSSIVSTCFGGNGNPGNHQLPILALHWL